MQITIYGCFIDGLCHYVGQTTNLRKRLYSHRGKTFRGRSFIMRPLRTVSSLTSGARIESQIIRSYKKRGQCELNKQILARIPQHPANWPSSLAAPVIKTSYING